MTKGRGIKAHAAVGGWRADVYNQIAILNNQLVIMDALEFILTSLSEPSKDRDRSEAKAIIKGLKSAAKDARNI